MLWNRHFHGKDELGKGLPRNLPTVLQPRTKKEGSGGLLLRLKVAISFQWGVVVCESYEQMCRAFFLPI